MISLCTVSLSTVEHYERILCESIIKRTTLISEVIIARNDAPESLDETWEERGIKFRKFGHDRVSALHIDDQHALGLHACLDRAANDYIMFCDPDIFLFQDMDVVYITLFKDYNLNLVGGSYHSSPDLAQTFFPCAFNMMLRKSELPDKNYLKEDCGGCFLLQKTGTRHREKYPNPSGMLNTGSGFETVEPKSGEI